MSRDDLTQATKAHHALVRGETLRDLMSAQQIRTEVQRGNLERVHRDVYRVAGAPETRDQRLLAAVYAGGVGAVASHRSAAAMWELLDRWPEMPEISVRPPRRPRLRHVIVHRSLDLCDEVATSLRNVPLTVPSMTILDLGAVCGVRVVERALDRAIVSGITTVDEVDSLHRRLRRQGRSGAGPLAVVLEDLGLRSDEVDSVLETKMARLLKAHALPTATFHFVVYDDRGVPVAEVDFAYPYLKLAIEVDGFDAHGSPRALQLDLARQNRLVALGWTILRFTWNDVKYRPNAVASQIHQVLRALAVA
jgi:very-short-patch-repair endonuclease